MEVSEALGVDCMRGISYLLILNHYLHGVSVICVCQPQPLVALSIVCPRLCPHLLRQVLQPSLRSPFFPRVPRVAMYGLNPLPPALTLASGETLLWPWSHRVPRTCCCCPLKPHCPRAPWRTLLCISVYTWGPLCDRPEPASQMSSRVSLISPPSCFSLRGSRAVGLCFQQLMNFKLNSPFLFYLLSLFPRIHLEVLGDCVFWF